MRNVGRDLNVLDRRERKLAADAIGGSKIILCIKGVQGQGLVALSDRLVIVKSGFMSGSTFGGRASTFHYRDIGGLQLNKGLGTATLEVHTSSLGATKSGDYWMQRRNEDPFHLPNVIPLVRAELRRLRPYLDELNALIADAKRPSQTVQQVAPPREAEPGRHDRKDDLNLGERLGRIAELHAA
jgi:hypothetical protein